MTLTVSDAPKPRKVFAPRVFPTVFMLAALALFGTLGKWQADRYFEQAAAAELYHHQHDVLPPLTSLAEGTTGEPRLHVLNFRRATLTGSLDMQHVQLLTARYMLGKLGYAVIVPMQLPERPGHPLLVHLGWASAEDIGGFLAELRAHPQRTVTGRLQRPEAHDPKELPVGVHLGVPKWRHPNPRALAAVVPGLDTDLMLQAGTQAVGDVVDPKKVPLDGYMYPIHPLPSKNVEYAATWFGLAMTVVAVWIAFSLRSAAPNAEQAAVMMKNWAKAILRREGAADLPENFGDIVLSGAPPEELSSVSARKFAAALRSSYEEKVADGMRIEDFRWWWNLSPLVRATVRANDILYFVEEFAHAWKQAETQAISDDLRTRIATRSIQKAFPVYQPLRIPELVVDDKETVPFYGLDTQIELSSSEDRPLPEEIKQRVNMGRDQLLRERGSAIIEEIDGFSSCNAWARAMIRKGTL